MKTLELNREQINAITNFIKILNKNKIEYVVYLHNNTLQITAIEDKTTLRINNLSFTTKEPLIINSLYNYIKLSKENIKFTDKSIIIDNNITINSDNLFDKANDYFIETYLNKDLNFTKILSIDKNILKNLNTFRCKNNIRPHLQGVNVNANGLFAVDGYRLVKYNINIDTDKQFYLNHIILDTIVKTKLSKTIDMYANFNNNVCNVFINKDILLIQHNILSTIDINKLFDKSELINNTITFNVKEFLNILKNIKKNYKDNTLNDYIVLNINFNKLTIVCEYLNNIVKFELNIKSNVDNFKKCFNKIYLLELLDLINKEKNDIIDINLNKSVNPLYVNFKDKDENNSYESILLPVRISK